MLSRKFTWWCFEGFFKIFFRGESLSVFGCGGLEGGVHYSHAEEDGHGHMKNGKYREFLEVMSRMGGNNFASSS